MEPSRPVEYGETPTKPLPMVRDPRMVFDQLFGVGGSRQERADRRQMDRSILDWVSHTVADLKTKLGPRSLLVWCWTGWMGKRNV